MAYDLEEQEQLDAFKAWWKANGNKVLLVVGIAIASGLGIQGWKYYQNKQSMEASVQYQLLAQADPKDVKTVQSISANLMEKYASTPYAARAALAAAKVNYTADDTKSAAAQLEWAAKNAKEEAVKSVALLQLAALQLEQKQYDIALKTLAEKHASGFDGLFADLKGDILVAQGKNDEAKQAYKDALAKLDEQGRYHHYTARKLEALGG